MVTCVSPTDGAEAGKEGCLEEERGRLTVK